MKAILILFPAALAAFSARAGLPPQNGGRVAEIAAFLPAEPGFPETCITNRAVWDRIAARCPEKVRAAECLLTNSIPVVDDRTYEEVYPWNRPSAEITRRIDRLVFAECIENRGRFLPMINAYLEAKIAQTTWVNPYHDRPKFGNIHGTYQSIDLDSSWNAETVAIAVDLLRERLPSDLRQRAVAACWRVVFDNYLQTARTGALGRNGWFFGNNNWNVACHGWSVGAALRVVSDRTERAKFIEAAERAYPFYLNGFSGEGYCQEGLDYWNFGFSMYLHLGHIVRAATRDRVDFFASEKAKACARYALEFQLVPGVCPQFGDGTASVPSTRNLQYASFAWPEFVLAETCRLSPVHGTPNLPYLTFRPGAFDPPGAADSRKLPLRTLFRDAQVYIGRPAAGDAGAMSVCMKGGHNGVPHNHNDAGQYVIALGDVQMVQDPSGAKYTLDTFGPKRYDSPMLNSYAHAVPYPDGTLQGAGQDRSAQIILTRFTDEKDVVELDLRGAYTNDNIRTLTRRLAYDRARARIGVRDHVAFARPAPYETAISTFGTIEKGETEGSFAIVRRTRDGKGVLRLPFTVDCGGAKWHVKEERIPNPTRDEPTRFAIVLDEPVAEATVTVLFRPNEPLVRVGITTDTHFGRPDVKGVESCEKAWRIFKDRGCALVAHCGDIADRFSPDAYAEVCRMRERVFGDPKTAPREVWVYAYHDRIGMPDDTDKRGIGNYALLKDLLRIPHEAYDSFSISGFEFLVVPQAVDFGKYETMLAAACAKSPGKPVFVFDHHPGRSTTENSDFDGDARRRDLLEKFPQVVHITGHAHGSLYNEQNIHQAAYTSVSAACLTYFTGHYVGAVAGTGQNRSVLVLEIFGDHAVFRRYAVESGEEIGADEPWTIRWPYDPKKPFYSPESMRARHPPATFPSGAVLSVTRGPNLLVEFPETGSRFTWYYRIEAYREDGSAGRSVRILRRDVRGEYWRDPKDRKGIVRDALDAAYFTAGEEIVLTVTPCDFWGGEGEPLTWRGAAPECGYRLVCRGEVEKGTFRLPDLSPEVDGKALKVVVDVEIDQSGSVPIAIGVKACDFWWAARMSTPPGRSKLTYVFDIAKARTDTRYEFSIAGGTEPRSVEFTNLRILAKPPRQEISGGRHAVIFKGDARTAYRDPAAVFDGDLCHLFFTLVETEADGSVHSYVAKSESVDLRTWTPPRKLTPKSDRDYSSPGNVIRDGNGWVLCFQSYPRPGNRDDGVVRYADETARLFAMRSDDLVRWSEPELLRVKGPAVAEKDMGRMIDPYLIRGADGFWWCFFKQNGASMSRSRDLQTWEYVGRTEAGENVCVIPADHGYLMFHSPRNGIAVKRSDDLVHWADVQGLITLGQTGWPWARGRLTAGFVLDGRSLPGVGTCVLFFHGSGPKAENEGDFDRNASIAMVTAADPLSWLSSP